MPHFQPAAYYDRHEFPLGISIRTVDIAARDFAASERTGNGRRIEKNGRCGLEFTQNGRQCWARHRRSFSQRF
jgi:hypothetical protein